MSLGFAQGFDYQSFCKAVKTLTLIVIDGETRQQIELPLEYFNVGIHQIAIKRRVKVEPEKKIVLHIEITSDNKINAMLPDNFCIALGMLDYARERIMEQLVRPSFRSNIILADQVPQA